MTAANPPDFTQSPETWWGSHACRLQELMLALAEAGTDIALKLKTLSDANDPGSSPVEAVAGRFCEVASSVRLAAALAYKFAQPLPPAPAAQKPPAQSQVKPEPRDPGRPSPEARPTEARDTEARDTEARDRLQDPLREHDLNRPVPVMVGEIASTLARHAPPAQAAMLQRTAADSVSLAQRLASTAQPPLDRATRRRLEKARRQEQKRQATRPHPSG